MNRVHLPRSLEGAWEILDRVPEARVYAGGTDLFVKLQGEARSRAVLVCLERIRELRGIRDAGKHVWIGACTPYTEILSDPSVQEHFPVLSDAIRKLGSPLIRNMGTMGGNICTASPAGDTLPPLYILEATLEIRSHSNTRRIPVQDFILGPGQARLEPGEILSGIEIQKGHPYPVHFYEKVGQRQALAIAVVSLAVMMRLSEAGDIEAIRMAFGSVAPTVVRPLPIETQLAGAPLDEKTLREAGAMLQAHLFPIDDIRASARYRRRVSANILQRLRLRGKASMKDSHRFGP